jgi:hypothetical protein
VKRDEPEQEVKIRLLDNLLLVEPKGSGDKPIIEEKWDNRIKSKGNQAKLYKKGFKQRIDFILQKKVRGIPYKKESCK